MKDLCEKYSEKYNVFIDDQICNRVILSLNEEAQKLSDLWEFETTRYGNADVFRGKAVSKEEQEILNEKFGERSTRTATFLEYLKTKLSPTENLELSLNDKFAWHELKRTYAGGNTVYVKR